MKVSVSIQLPEHPPERAPKKRPPSLKERVEYAIDCIECESPSKQEAIEFLRAAYDYLQRVDHPNQQQRNLSDRILPIINEYGTYHRGSSDPKES